MIRRKHRSRVTRESLEAHCGQLGVDDCVDPHDYFRTDRRSSKENRKSLRLCRQVFHCLSMVLADCDDAMMQSLSVADVIPAPDSSRLLVLLDMDRQVTDVTSEQLLARAVAQVPRLRSEIASSIHRKRVPTLALQIVPTSVQTEATGDE